MVQQKEVTLAAMLGAAVGPGLDWMMESSMAVPKEQHAADLLAKKTELDWAGLLAVPRAAPMVAKLERSSAHLKALTWGIELAGRWASW